MVLTRADDFPIHQTCEPIAYAGTDRNFYDRYFFNGYSMQAGDTAFFAAAFGVYPHLNIADAAFVVVRNGVETALHASRWLQMERLDLQVGPVKIEVIEPLKVLRLLVDAPEQSIKADITFAARAEPIEEPRFVRRNGPRTFMDYTRLTQNGRWSGWIEIDGVRERVDAFVGTRDRSWGIRPIGARDAQELAPPVAPQFFWLWSPTNFPEGSFFFHTNDDEHGAAWNRRAVWQSDGHPTLHIDDPRVTVDWMSGTRHAAAAVVTIGAGEHQRTITYTPIYAFFMLGLGYGHPTWGHGNNQGELLVEREDIVLADVDPRLPPSPARPGPLRRDLQGGVGLRAEGPRGVRATGPRTPCAIRVQGDAGLRAMRIHAPQGLQAPMTLEGQIAAYLTDLWRKPVTVENLARIPGGASRQTYRFDAVMGGETHGLILRRDPVDSLIDTDRRIEYLAYQSFHPLGVPTPEPLVLEEDGGVLERPFFLMSRIDGGKAASPFTIDAYAPHEAEIGRQFFSILGRIAAADPATLPIAAAARTPTLETCWCTELDHWEKELDKDELYPNPIGRAAIRRLRRHPPKPAQKLSVAHGDYRSGNFMHDGEGRIIAILDWEMAHIGDPLEDLAWAIDPLWSHFDPTRVSGLLPRTEAIAFWEATSGLKADPAALQWWELFNSFKGLVIWISAAKSFRDGAGLDPILGFTGLYCTRRHDQILAEKLEAFLEAEA